jgi:hypothetical protein
MKMIDVLLQLRSYLDEEQSQALKTMVRAA